MSTGLVTTNRIESLVCFEMAGIIFLKFKISSEGANSTISFENVTLLTFFLASAYNLNHLILKRSAFAITDTELKLIAAAAIIGLSKIPNTGNNTPAAIGTPRKL